MADQYGSSNFGALSGQEQTDHITRIFDRLDALDTLADRMVRIEQALDRLQKRFDNEGFGSK